MAVHDFCADEKRGNIQTETLFWWLGCESSMMGIWYPMQWHHDVRWMTRQGQDTIKRILSWTQLQRDSDWTWLKHREPLCLTFLLIMMIHIILKLRNIKDLWDCDSDAPEILPPSCHMPSPWPGLSGTSVLLRQPTWIYSSSTPEPFNNLCQKCSQTFTDVHRRSQTFTDVQKLRHVRIEMKLVYFILFPDVASSLLLSLRFSCLFEVNQLASKKCQVRMPLSTLIRLAESQDASDVSQNKRHGWKILLQLEKQHEASTKTLSQHSWSELYKAYISFGSIVGHAECSLLRRRATREGVAYPAPAETLRHFWAHVYCIEIYRDKLNSPKDWATLT